MPLIIKLENHFLEKPIKFTYKTEITHWSLKIVSKKDPGGLLLMNPRLINVIWFGLHAGFKPCWKNVNPLFNTKQTLVC